MAAVAVVWLWVCGWCSGGAARVLFFSLQVSDPRGVFAVEVMVEMARFYGGSGSSKGLFWAAAARVYFNGGNDIWSFTAGARFSGVFGGSKGLRWAAAASVCSTAAMTFGVFMARARFTGGSGGGMGLCWAAAARVCFDGGNGSWNFTAGVRWWQMAQLTGEEFRLWFLDGWAARWMMGVLEHGSGGSNFGAGVLVAVISEIMDAVARRLLGHHSLVVM